MNLTEGPIFRQMLRFSVPLILTNMLTGLYTLADTLVVGRFAGKAAMAAVGNSGPILNILGALALGVSLGAGIWISQKVGEQNEEAVTSSIHTSLILSLLLGIVFTVIGIVNTPAMLKFAKTPGEIYWDSFKYLIIYFSGFVFTLLYSFLAAIFRAMGDSKSPLVFLIISAAVNVGLNVLFVAVFNWGVSGVSFATVISQVAAAVTALIFLAKRRKFKLSRLKEFRFNRRFALIMTKLGLPVGVSMAISNVTGFVVSKTLNSYNDVALIAGATVSTNVGYQMSLMISGFSAAVLSFAGQNYGAKNFARIKKGTWTAFLMSFVSVGAVTALVVAFAHPVFSLFNGDPKVIEWATVRFIYVYGLYFLYAGSECLTSMLKACGYTTLTMGLSIAMCILSLVLVMVLDPIFRDIRVVFAVFPFTHLVTFILSYVMYKIKLRKIENI